MDPDAARGQRYWYMDSLRAALMIAGVFYHAAIVYSVGGEWLVRDPGPYLALDVFAAALSSFRMPTFFVIAGFFCAMLYRRPGARGVLRRRLVMLGLPFLSLGLTVQPLQYLLTLHQSGQLAGLTPLRFLASYLATGAFIGHLWFILTLMIYYLGVSAFLTSDRLKAWGSLFLRSPHLHTLLRSKATLAMVCAAMSVGATYLANGAGAGIGYQLDDVPRYLPFFLVGAVGFIDPALLDSFLSVSAWDAAVLAAVVVIVGMLRGGVEVSHVHGLLPFGEFAFYVVGLTVAAFLVKLCRRWLDGRSPLQQTLVDASYSIYLFHHVCVVALGMFLLARAPGLNALVKYALVAGVATLVPVALHTQVLRRWVRIRLLFNGRTTSTSA